MIRTSALPPWIALTLALPACVHTYEPPRADPPHAVVNVRRGYEQRTGALLPETGWIHSHRAYDEDTPVEGLGGPRHGALLHTKPARFRQEATFFHFSIFPLRDAARPRERCRAHGLGARSGSAAMLTSAMG